MKYSPTIKAHFMMFLWALLIATSFPAASLVATKISAVSLTAIRFFVATVIFLPFVIQKGKIELPGVKEFLSYSILGFCLAFYFWALFKSLNSTTPLNTGAIFTLIPAMTAVNAYFLAGTKISRLITASLFIGCLGSVFVVIRGDINKIVNLDLNEGDLIFLIGCVVLSLYSPLIQLFNARSSTKRSATYMTFWVMAIGTLMLLIAALTELNGELNWTTLNSNDLFVVLYLAIFTTIITFWQLQYCTPILGAVVVMSYTYLIPSIVFLIELAFFSRRFGEHIYLGIMLTIVSLILLNFRSHLFNTFKHKEINGGSL